MHEDVDSQVQQHANTQEISVREDECKSALTQRYRIQLS